MASSRREFLTRIGQKMAGHGVGRLPEANSIDAAFFGRMIFEWVDGTRFVQLFEDGVRASTDALIEVSYSSVREVQPMRLVEVMRRTSDPDARSVIRLHSEGEPVELIVPMRLYTFLCSALSAVAGATKRFDE